MPKIVEKCELCKCFLKHSYDEAHDGVCRLEPPPVNGKRPFVNCNSWCSHFQLKIDKEQLLVEKLANYAHEAWTGWMDYLFSKTLPIDNNSAMVIPSDSETRWRRQMKTPYSELPEDEKESDRKEARKIIDILEDSLTRRLP
jgi:hypothetical protein